MKSFTAIFSTALIAMATFVAAAPHHGHALPAPALFRRGMLNAGIESTEIHKQARRHRTNRRQKGGNRAGRPNRQQGGQNQTPVATAQSAAVGVKSASTSTTSTSTDSSIPAKLKGTVTGKATFYFQGGVAGSCGTVAKDSDKVVALQEGVMTSSLCGKRVQITNTATGQSVTAVVRDTCPGCDGVTSMDMSQGAFDAIGDEDTGVLDISWHFI